MNKIQIISADEKEPHCHAAVELLYVLTGKVEIYLQDEVFRAGPKDIVLINSEEVHCFSSEEDSLICRVYADYYLLKKNIKKTPVRFRCNSVQEPEKEYSRLRYILEIILNHYAEGPESFVIESLYYSLLEVLKKNFLSEDSASGADTEAGRKIKSILDYIQENYAMPLNLREMADRSFMSVSAFSRFFKRETGIGFAEYLRNFRLENARDELRYTNKSITEVALDSGFSNLSVFNKIFRQSFLQTPNDFRQSECQPEEKEISESPELLEQYLKKTKADREKEQKKQLRISADIREGKLFKNRELSSINAGMFVDLQEGKTQKHIEMIVHDLGIKYIHLSNPFDPELLIRSGHETGAMNFDKTDAVLDQILEWGCIPVIEFPARRKKLIRRVGRNGNLKVQNSRTDSTFLSLAEWKETLRMLMVHLAERYTAREINRWMFEIWYDIEKNEGLGKTDYRELYEESWKIIHDYAPDAKIGGSGVNTTMDIKALREQLLWWKDRADRPDFLTFISYPYQVKQYENTEYELLDIESDLHFIRKDLDSYYDLLRQLDYPQTPVCISEWNTSLSERNIYNDSCAKACHMLTQMTDVCGRTAMMNYGNVSDCAAQYYDSVLPLSGSTGIITRDGLLKPAYYALEFWSLLGNRLLERGENYIITSQNSDSVQILAFNAKKFGTSYHMKAEDQLNPRELPYIFKDNDPVEMDFEIKGISNGKHKVCLSRMKESSGNVLAEWGRLGYSETLLRSEISYLKKICIPRMEARYISVDNMRLHLHIELEASEICMIQIM